VKHAASITGRSILLGWLLTGPLWLSGCIGYLPTPTLHEDYGMKITPEMVRFVRPGITARAEVIAHLGTNYVSLPQDRAMGYPWETKGLSFEWYFVMMGWDGGYSEKTDCETSPTGARWQAFFLAYDDHAVVRATCFKKLTTNNKSLDEQLDRWQSRLPDHQPATVPP
jgi:hypothetical protein